MARKIKPKKGGGKDVGLLSQNFIVRKDPKYARRLSAHVFKTNDAQTQIVRFKEVLARVFDHETPTTEFQETLKILFKIIAIDIILGRHIYMFLWISHQGLCAFKGDEEDIVSEKTNVPYFSFATSSLSNFIFHVAGLSLEMSIKFALLLFDHYADILQQVAKRNDVDESLVRCEAIYYGIIANSLEANPNSRMRNTRRWFDNLIEVVDKDPVVGEMVGLICDVYGTNYSDSGIAKAGEAPVIFVRTLTAIEHAQSFFSGALKAKKPAYGKYKGRVVVREEHKPQFTTWISQRNDMVLVKRNRVQRDLDWFEENADLIAQRKIMMQEQIRLGVNRWFRFAGADHVEFSLPALKFRGMRSVIFYPEQVCEFPQVGISLIVKTQTPHVVSVNGCVFDVESFTVDKSTDYIKNVSSNWEEIWHVIEYVLLDIMYRITVTGDEPRRKSRAKSGGQSNGEDVSHPVRPHFRRLLPGQNPGAEARHLAKKKLGWESLPPMKTFVKAHYRGGQLVYDGLNEPVYVYDLEELYGSLLS